MCPVTPFQAAGRCFTSAVEAGPEPTAATRPAQGPEGGTAAPPATGAALPWARPELAAGQELEVQLSGVWHAATVREVQPGGWVLVEVDHEDLDGQWAMDEEGYGSEGSEDADGGEAAGAPERPGGGPPAGAGAGVVAAAGGAAVAAAAGAAAAAEQEDGGEEGMDHDGNDGEDGDEAPEVTLLRVQVSARFWLLRAGPGAA